MLTSVEAVNSAVSPLLLEELKNLKDPLTTEAWTEARITSLHAAFPLVSLQPGLLLLGKD